MSNPIDRNGWTPPLEPTHSFDQRANVDQESGLDNDLNARVAEQAETTFNQMEEETRYFKTSQVEELDNTLRERVSAQEDHGGVLSGILARIRRAVGGFWRRRGRQETSQQVKLMLSEASLQRVQDVANGLNGTQGRLRAFFQQVFDALLSCIRRSPRTQINLRGFDSASPEGFLILAMIARTICKIASKRDEDANNYASRELFIESLNNSVDLAIPSIARVEAIFSGLDRMMHRSNDQSTPLIRGVSFLSFLPKDQQKNLKQKIQSLAALDTNCDYTYLIDAADRMDDLLQQGAAEAQAISNMLYVFRMELSQFLGNSFVQCYEKFQDSIDFRFLNVVLEDLVPQVDDLFHNPHKGLEQTTLVQELVMKLYFSRTYLQSEQ